MTAMQEAFARVGINGYGVRQVGRQLPPRQPAPDPSIPPENKGIGITRERVLEAVAAITAMSDGELDIEALALEENAEAIRVELRGVAVEPQLHEVGWQRRAERALAGIKTRLALCNKERDQRRSVARQAQKLASHEEEMRRRLEHDERLRLEHERKLEKIAASNRQDNAESRAFIRHARHVLSDETWDALWAAVRDEMPPP